MRIILCEPDEMLSKPRMHAPGPGEHSDDVAEKSFHRHFKVRQTGRRAPMRTRRSSETAIVHGHMAVMPLGTPCWIEVSKTCRIPP